MFFKPTSFHVLEKENTENLITWNYPSISDELKTVLIKTCFSHGVEACGLFYFKRLGKQWIHIKQFIVNNDKAAAVIVVSQCFQPKLYETLCDLFAAQYSRSGSGADLVKLYLQIYTKNGIYDNDDFISLNNFTWKTNLKGLIKSLGLETILIYNALLLKKQILVYHSSVEDLQEGLASITKLVLIRKPEDLLLPLANSLSEIKEVSTYSLIGTINKNLLHQRNIFDVFIDLESQSITLTDKARDDFQMSSLHKEIAHFLVQLSESDGSEQDLITAVARKTSDLFKYLKSFCDDKEEGIKVTSIESKLSNKKLAIFLINLAMTENILVI
ncbi:DENN domain-containing protein 10 isoform X1 [Diabrotica virgifera virgifera]|uniref:Protein FAM45A-like isoform X1 n=1 Tax=Diabrotica virgifera virgifera TaxID=50390 RepID=A0A6P7FHL6_DIAVI|nr:DENN domain-containing protein 10 isoform X1 [Diabrotica virgifera virgifera]